MSQIPPPNPYEPSQNVPPQVQFPVNESDGTGGVIPYKNPHALIAYYLGIFSLITCFGLLLAIPAFILGIMGLSRAKKNPAIHGSVHAWIGIVMGVLMTIVWSGSIIFVFIASLARR
jgi:hypothetical protein